jgi:hypothetical protein
LNLAVVFIAFHVTRPAFGGYTFIDLYSVNTSSGPNLFITVGVGGQGVGNTYDKIASYAALWNGSGARINLHPNDMPGIVGSQATNSSGGQQVGTGYQLINSAQFSRAMVWNGTAASAIDLNPSGMISSVASGTSGGLQQVGQATASLNGPSHAFL